MSNIWIARMMATQILKIDKRKLGKGEGSRQNMTLGRTWEFLTLELWNFGHPVPFGNFSVENKMLSLFSSASKYLCSEDGMWHGRHITNGLQSVRCIVEFNNVVDHCTGHHQGGLQQPAVQWSPTWDCKILSAVVHHIRNCNLCTSTARSHSNAIVLEHFRYMLVFIESKKPGPVLQEVLTKSAVDQYLYISIHFVTIRGCCVDKILAKFMFPIQTSQAAGKEKTVFMKVYFYILSQILIGFIII